MEILTRKELDQILAGGCTTPGCKHQHEQLSEIFLHCRRHLEAGADICYSAEGILKITCRSCAREIGYISVADGISASAHSAPGASYLEDKPYGFGGRKKSATNSRGNYC
jgi:hypothetical protein